MRLRALRRDLVPLLVFLGLALVLFWPQTLGGKTMLPADAAFAWEPWRSYAAQVGVPSAPQNGLVADLYLENYAWKHLIRQTLGQGELPLWNPYLFAGVPFLAAGQHSALYPLSILFYVLPLPAAYGWFAALHLFLAGAFTYALGRTLGLSRGGALVSGVAFEFCGFIVIGNVFPMIVAAAVWLPLVLVAIEKLAQQVQAGRSWAQCAPALALGAISCGMVMLAGHPEMYYYIGLVSAAYGLWRMAALSRSLRKQGTARGRPLARFATLLSGLAVLGIGLGTVQWLPLLDLVRSSFRAEGASFRQVLAWAYPLRHVIALVLPDFYGNPAHHQYLDLFTGRWTPVTVNTLGQAIQSTEWGLKNYVEGAAYVGVLPMALAAIAVVRGRTQRTGFWTLLVAISLLLAFGAPIYYLIYKLPGLNQVHTPFRWIYAYSLAMAVLAGFGADTLAGAVDEHAPVARWRRWLGERALPWATLGIGASLVLGLGASWLLRERVADLCQRAMLALARTPEAFADGRMFYSYQARNVAILAAALTLGGALLVARRRLARRGLWFAGLALVAFGELYVIGAPFFPRVAPALVAYRTPAIDFLQADTEPYRLTALVGGDDKTFNANAGMFYDLADVRGYDSIIPRQYVAYMSLLHPQGELMYNRIAPISEAHREALDSPLLDMLNVKYVLASRERPITSASYSLAYDGEIRIYRNEDYMPRAFLVSRAVSVSDASERAMALQSLDPRREVIVEEPVGPEWTIDAPTYRPVEQIIYAPNEALITVDTPTPTWLVLADSYSPGWLAYRRAPEADTSDEQALHIYRANGNFRAVQVPAGRHVVRFKYSPDPVKYGAYLSFVSGMVLLLALGYWAWRRFYREPQGDLTVQRVTKNTVAPIVLNVANKVLDMALAMLMLRILGPVNAGQYYLAVVVIAWLDILINFGLNMLVTREVAKEPAQAGRYLWNSIVLRVGLWALAWPALAAFFLLRQGTKPLEPMTMLAIGLFLVGLLPSNISASYAAIFNAYERMEIPASVATLTTLLRVCLSTVALFLGTGYVGLAVVSIAVNVVTLGVLGASLRKRLFVPQRAPDATLRRGMLRDAWPLMINLLLATLFFKVAVLLLEWLLPDPRVLGWYSTAYKYIDAVGLVPAYFTLAIFPLMARYAASDREALLRAYRLAIKLLTACAVAFGFLFSGAAREWIALLGGSQYLPQAADVLRVMIWFMPFGFINSVTQYVLIALDQQRFITRAFAIALGFNVVANIVLISRFGHLAAAYVAIASELALLIPFYVGIRRHLAPIPWGALLWKPWASAAPLALMLWLLPHAYLPLTMPAGLALFGVGLYVLKVFDAGERQALARVLPVKRLRRNVDEPAAPR